MKPPSAIAGPADDLVLPDFSDRIDWEIELAAVIGRSTYRVDRADAMGHVAGYMIANDVTARDRVQRSDPGAFGPDWVGAKARQAFCRRVHCSCLPRSCPIPKTWRCVCGLTAC